MASRTALLQELTFELVDVLSRTASAGALKSESVGDMSVTYADSSEAEGSISALIGSYFAGQKNADGVPLIYAGVVLP